MVNARSLVNLPSTSTVSIQAFSKSCENLSNLLLLSNCALCANPRVHAKIDAIGFVDVSLPYI